MKYQRLFSLAVWAVVISLAAGCAAASNPVVVTATPNPGFTSGGVSTGPITGTSVSSNSSSGTLEPPITPTPLTIDASGNLSVGLTDNGGSVLMQVGQRFLLNLGETYNWTFSIDDQSIVSRVINVLTIRGSQGLFEAHKAGTTVLHATGDPVCRSSTPACMMPSIAFQVQITVE